MTLEVLIGEPAVPRKAGGGAPQLCHRSLEPVHPPADNGGDLLEMDGVPVPDQWGEQPVPDVNGLLIAKDGREVFLLCVHKSSDLQHGC